MDYINSINNIGSLAVQKPLTRADAGSEFTKIFYKELLKQVFASSSMGEENTLAASINQDIFIDKLAEEMARKNQLMTQIRATGEAQ